MKLLASEYIEMADLQLLIKKVALYVEAYMNNFDGSHDFNHIKRVLGISHTIHAEILASEPNTKLDATIITLAALLHDVGDRKYLNEGEDSNTLVRNLLVEFGAEDDLAQKVQTICAGVSYTSEMKDVEKVVKLVKDFPELAIVQGMHPFPMLNLHVLGRREVVKHVL